MDKVRIGIVGLGIKGGEHALDIVKGRIPNAELTAVCTTNPERIKWAHQNLGDQVKIFDHYQALYASGLVDGVMIATPHYSHSQMTIAALEKGLHVLVEKPAGVYTKQVREMNEMAVKSGRVFGIMFNQRTNPLYQKLRDLLTSGELGEIKRTNWIITNWYRTQKYFDSVKWRATWADDGGGVLLNQSPHQLDLWQWTCGMPQRVRAFCSFGKYHAIEVEDDVTAYVEYENGATGVFITSTGEAPGSNRLEVSGTKGKIVIEDNQLTLWRLRVSEQKFNEDYKGGTSYPECWKCEVPITGENTSHAGITRNWVDAILKHTPLLAPGVQGINSLELSNAMILSSWLDQWVDLPVNEDLFYEKLQEKIKESSYKKEIK